MKKRRYSLSIHISSLFFILILFIGSVLIAISYYSSQQLLAGSARTLAHEARNRVYPKCGSNPDQSRFSCH